MEKIKVLTNSKVFLKAGLFSFFLAVAILAPFLKIQMVTGSIVNAVLFLATFLLGVEAGILIGFLPSLVSAFSGLLPVPMMIMIPYIIMGNAILIIVFNLFRKRNLLTGIFLSSFLKFLFLYFSSSFMVSFFAQRSLPHGVISMMSWPQLLTALLGGLIVLVFLEFFEKI